MVLVWFGDASEGERWELAGAVGVPLLGHKRELECLGRWNVDQSESSERGKQRGKQRGF